MINKEKLNIQAGHQKVLISIFGRKDEPEVKVDGNYEVFGNAKYLPTKEKLVKIVSKRLHGYNTYYKNIKLHDKGTTDKEIRLQYAEYIVDKLLEEGTNYD